MRGVRDVIIRGGCIVLLGFSLSGCMSHKLAPARSHFYSSRFTQAEQELAEIQPDEKDAILLLMERGIIRQAMHKYESSTTDLLQAVERERYLMTHSATQTGASFLANDMTISYRGPPFERTLLHAFLAKSFLALGKWDAAAVEARNIIKNLQNLDDFPDDAYSRYMAGFCLELARDYSNAALQYRCASSLAKGVMIDDQTGAIGPQEKLPDKGATELVCFVGIGRSPDGSVMYYGLPPVSQPVYAEIYFNGVLAGRSYPFSNVSELLRKTLERKAAMQALKDVSRIVIKEVIADEIKKKDPGLGLLAEFTMLALESPDDRRWETLPMWLQVARMPCPADLKSYDVVFKTATGHIMRRMTITEPITRNDNLFVSFCRDLPPEISPATATKQ